MAVALIIKNCKWKTRRFINPSFSHSQYSNICSSQVKRDEKATMKAKIMDEFIEAASSDYIRRLWESLLATPHKWYDYRMDKRSYNAPDFKHINTGQGLWIESNKTHALVKSKLISLGRDKFAPSLVEDMWKSFFIDPSKWVDYRKIKKNKYLPDFRHEDTNEKLWLDDKRTPIWVLTKLNYVRDEAFAPFPSIGKLWRMLFVDPSKWHDYRRCKKSNKHPDFVHKDTTEGLWIEVKKTPHWISPMLNELPDDIFAPVLSVDNLWISFFDDQSKWIDVRKIKKYSKYPDFKHKDSGEALWIVDHRTPFWVFSKLNDMWDQSFMPCKSMEDLWRSFFADPMKWLDYRKTKENKNFPDFRHKDTYDSLWVGHPRTPSWVLPKLNDLLDEAFVTTQPVGNLWISVFVEQSNWHDYRQIKKSNKHPDFVHKDTKEALWISDIKTPDWAKDMLGNVKNETFSPLAPLDHLWESLFANPSKWFDKRKIKKSSKHPDFVNKDTLEVLWIRNKRNPDWVLPKLKHFQAITAENEILESHEAKWKAYFACPSNWFDNRTSKKNINFPDFCHKDTKEGLWITSKWTPDWVMPNLSKLENEVR